MVTDISKGRDSTVPVFIGLSTDTKPTDVDNGSEFREFDTGKLYYFDAENVEWCEQPGEGGGGGGGDFNYPVITYDFDTSTGTCSMSFADMKTLALSFEDSTIGGVVVTDYENVAHCLGESLYYTDDPAELESFGFSADEAFIGKGFAVLPDGTIETLA